MDVYKLLPRREDLGHAHIIGHKPISDILELVVAKGMIGGNGEMPSAILNIYEDILALVVEESR